VALSEVPPLFELGACAVGGETDDEDTVYFDRAARPNTVERRPPSSDTCLAVDREDVMVEPDALLTTGDARPIRGYARAAEYRFLERGLLVSGVLGEEGRGRNGDPDLPGAPVGGKA
jgi:hypothetical protein